MLSNVIKCDKILENIIKLLSNVIKYQNIINIIKYNKI